MSVINVKTNFTAGQISEKLLGRGDLGLFENGAKVLQNVIIQPTGGIERRAGSKYISEIESKSRLIAFEFNSEQVYLLCFYHKKIKVFKDDKCITTLDSPWEEKHLNKLNWTQSADTLLIVHEDVEPQEISRNNDEVWKISPWVFYGKDGQMFCPYFNFFQKKESITPTGNSYTIKLNAVNDIFDESYVGSRIKINGGEGMITAFHTPKSVSMWVSKLLVNTVPSTDWQESSFSARRGWPKSVTFHQGRTVIGGSKSLPNRLWLSVSSDLFNFNLGTGLDDESIEFAILSDQVNAIENVISNRHLLVFTTGAEWMVSGEPLAPTSIRLNMQTKVGSYVKASMQPQNIDGATIFISQNGRQLREFLYSDVEQAYQGKDLTLMASDIMSKPIDFTFNQNQNILYVILEDGSVSCLTSYRSEEVTAWSKFITKGKYLSVAIVGEDIYFCIERNNKFYIEKVDENIFSDCSLVLESLEPKTTWDGLEIFEGKEVRVLADEFDVGIYEVINGKIKLIEPAKIIKPGYSYEHIIEPLPFMVEHTKPYGPKAIRIINSIFRIINSKSLALYLGKNFIEVPLKKINKDNLMDTAPKKYSGNVELKSLGWIRDLNQPMWKISGVEPYGFTLLSVVNEIKIKGE